MRCLLAAISIPTIVSVSEDALDAVPRSYRDAALALGATRWQTIWRVTLPAARSGVLTAVMLGIGRAIGETMAVMMVTGNAPVMPTGLGALFSPARTMTATIAAEMGEVANGSSPLPRAVLHRHRPVRDLAGGQSHRFGVRYSPAQTRRAGPVMRTHWQPASQHSATPAIPIQRLGFALLTCVAVPDSDPNPVDRWLHLCTRASQRSRWEFLTGFPEQRDARRGNPARHPRHILADVGTAMFSVPLGIAAAIYLSEYATENRWTRPDPHRHHQPGGYSIGGLRAVRAGSFVLFLQFGTSILAVR